MPEIGTGDETRAEQEPRSAARYRALRKLVTITARFSAKTSTLLAGARSTRTYSTGSKLRCNGALTA